MTGLSLSKARYCVIDLTTTTENDVIDQFFFSLLSLVYTH